VGGITLIGEPSAATLPSVEPSADEHRLNFTSLDQPCVFGSSELIEVADAHNQISPGWFAIDAMVRDGITRKCGLVSRDLDVLVSDEVHRSLIRGQFDAKRFTIIFDRRIPERSVYKRSFDKTRSYCGKISAIHSACIPKQCFFDRQTILDVAKLSFERRESTACTNHRNSSG
jgi:hypothetical protein